MFKFVEKSSAMLEEVEQELGVEFPPDFKQYVEKNGYGEVENIEEFWFDTGIPVYEQDSDVVKQKTNNDSVSTFYERPLFNSADDFETWEYLPSGIAEFGDCVSGSTLFLDCRPGNDFGKVYYKSYYWDYPWEKHFFELRRQSVLAEILKREDIEESDLAEHPEFDALTGEFNRRVLLVEVAASFDEFITKQYPRKD